MITTIMFDYYGVLTTDSYMVWLQHHPELAEQHAAEIEELSQAQDDGLDSSKFFQRLAGIAGLPVDSVREEFTTRGIAHEGLIDYIRQLRRHGLKTAIVSNSDVGLYEETAKRRLTKLFEVILCSEEAGVTKPDPQIFRLALERLQSTPDETLFVDDREYNVRGAEAAGISGIVYTDLADFRTELARRGIAGA